LGREQPKPVEVKSTQKMTLVKEDCVLEDETGTAEIHIWDKTHQQDQKWDNI